MNILVLNWRDRANTGAGGAEVYVHGIIDELIHKGHTVTLFCSKEKTLFPRERKDGLTILRKGSTFTTYAWAAFHYLFNRNYYDAVIESQNGIPYLAPLYVKKPFICIVHHIHREIFSHYLPFPLDKAAALFERMSLRFVYKKTSVIVVSQSTSMELTELGIQDITVINPTANKSCVSGVKTAHPSMLYLGRLRKHKNVDMLIEIFSSLKKSQPSLTLTIAGEGDERGALQKLADEKGVSVRFTGSVSEETKQQLMREAWVFCTPSSKEGFGITAIEAASCGTPVVAFDVPGLRDSVKHSISGLLVPYKDKVKMELAIEKIIENTLFRTELEQSCIRLASSSDNQKFGKVIELLANA
jgi:glycosyltransferase involved in cell wall biosynthesis